MTEADILGSLPIKPVILRTIVVTRILSSTDVKPLGYFETPYAYHPDAVASLEKFRSKLKKIGRTIDGRNQDGGVDYLTLHPNNIPNSISD